MLQTKKVSVAGSQGIFPVSFNSRAVTDGALTPQETFGMALLNVIFNEIGKLKATVARQNSMLSQQKKTVERQKTMISEQKRRLDSQTEMFRSHAKEPVD